MIKNSKNIVFEKIVILGTGQLFLDCLSDLAELPVFCIGYDTGNKPGKVTAAKAASKGLPYAWKEKNKIYEELEKEDKKTLLLSVINPSVVPETVLRNQKILGINCHQALLPEYRGRNAESWAIFDGKTKTGITWHKLEPKVDIGDILAQREVIITENTTAYALFRQQLAAAREAFLDFMPDLLAGKAVFFPQQKGSSCFHYSFEVPENGRLDLAWSGEKISRFLRALDYCSLSVMPRPVVCYSGKDYTVGGYEIQKGIKKQFTMKEGDIQIIKDDYNILLKKCLLTEKNKLGE